MEGCLFCKIITRELPGFILWEDEEFLAFLDINPVNPGHTLLVTKDHQEDVVHLDDETYSRLFLAAKELVRPLKAATKAKRIAIAVEGLSIPHLHIHLVPVHGPNELDPNRARRASEEELARMWQRIMEEKLPTTDLWG
ncbi:MAG: HIT family protein [Thermoplasmata archaeon]|nr:HIT family protein [Thermoplasmata archaeon]